MISESIDRLTIPNFSLPRIFETEFLIQYLNTEEKETVFQATIILLIIFNDSIPTPKITQGNNSPTKVCQQFSSPNIRKSWIYSSKKSILRSKLD